MKGNREFSKGKQGKLIREQGISERFPEFVIRSSVRSVRIVDAQCIYVRRNEPALFPAAHVCFRSQSGLTIIDVGFPLLNPSDTSAVHFPQYTLVIQ
jgi:hypothetical protein